MKMVSIGSGGPEDEVGVDSVQMGIGMGGGKLLFGRAWVRVDVEPLAHEMELERKIDGS